MRAVAIIPARMAAARYPGKPLVPILGRSMLEHVFRRASLCRALAQTIVATCDDEIREAAEGFGARVIMTSASHRRACDRVAEAAGSVDADIVVMIQGDEPMLFPDMIDAALSPFAANAEVNCVNLSKRILDRDEFLNRNTIKVIMDRKGDAIYFSRQPIPDAPMGDFSAIQAYRQVCIMPFRRKTLELFATLPQSPLEIAESIDMLRFIENRVPIRMVETTRDTHSVDVPAERDRVEVLLRSDALVVSRAY